MKTLTVPVSDVAEEALRREADRQGKSVERFVGDLLEEDARQRSLDWLAAELKTGIQAAEAGQVVTIEADALVDHIRDRYNARQRG